MFKTFCKTFTNISKLLKIIEKFRRSPTMMFERSLKILNFTHPQNFLDFDLKNYHKSGYKIMLKHFQFSSGNILISTLLSNLFFICKPFSFFPSNIVIGKSYTYIRVTHTGLSQGSLALCDA